MHQNAVICPFFRLQTDLNCIIVKTEFQNFTRTLIIC